MSNIRKLFLILTVLGVMLLLAVIPSIAQTTGEVELVGSVESLTLNTITVNGQEIDVTTAEVSTPIEVGTIVKIEGWLNADGSITAREVEAATDILQPGEAELIGLLDSFEGTIMVVNGQTVDVSGTEIKAGVTVGELVKVHATATDVGTWMARQVEPYTPVADDTDAEQSVAGEFEIIGTLQEISTDFIVVSGGTISIVGAEVKDTLVIGVLVKVHVSLVNGELVAREVENAFVQSDNSSSADNADDDMSDDNGSVSTAISAQQAIEIVLSIYPNTTVTEIHLDDKFGGTLVWEIHTSHGIELNIDAQTGVILTIDAGDDNSVGVPVGNGNTDDNPGNGDAPGVPDNHGNDNEGSDDHGNDNSGSDDDPSIPDDHGNDNDGDDDHSDEPPTINDNDNSNDNSGVPPVINDNDNDDDNSGMGSGSDDSGDDNSGMGSDDD